MAGLRFSGTQISEQIQFQWAASGGATPQSSVITLPFRATALAVQVYASKWPSAAGAYLNGSLYSSADVDGVTNTNTLLSAVPSATVTGKVLFFNDIPGLKYVRLVASGAAACSGEAGSGYIVAIG